MIKIDDDYNILSLNINLMIRTLFNISTNSSICILQFYIDFVYPLGKPRNAP